MFAYPAVSPSVQLSSGERAYQVAYLQALFPAQGERSRYRLMVMDRDGSNRRALYPLEGSGLEPQRLVCPPNRLPNGAAMQSPSSMKIISGWLIPSAANSGK